MVYIGLKVLLQVVNVLDLPQNGVSPFHCPEEEQVRFVAPKVSYPSSQ